MKKFLALTLALVVVFSLCTSAFAAGTPSKSAPESDSGSTSAVPATYTGTTTEKADTVILTEYAKEDDLTAEQKETFDKAYEDLANVAPEGYTSQYFCYASAEKYPVDVVIDIQNATDVLAKLYANGAWQDLACKVDGNKVTVTLPCEGALAIFTK